MKKIEEFITREIAGEYVMMPVGKTAQKFNGLILTNEVSAFIWEHIECVKNLDELVILICKEFDVSYEEAWEDTTELINQMKTAGWIEG
ncbi:PqqD family protein [Lachnospiraceae bacterium HCP28S3_F9]